MADLVYLPVGTDRKPP